ncbi:MAG: hypothetical protein MJE63_11810 [Proteobacteria bacterium]|nr:hypothetical protein [Pseudomonadota bacterium]
MKNFITIGIIGDFEERPSQMATNEALQGAKEYLGRDLQWKWIHTNIFQQSDPGETVQKYQGILCGPGSYSHPPGAIHAIQYCRKNDVPFLGT